MTNGKPGSMPILPLNVSWTVTVSGCSELVNWSSLDFTSENTTTGALTGTAEDKTSVALMNPTIDSNFVVAFKMMVGGSIFALTGTYIPATKDTAAEIVDGTISGCTIVQDPPPTWSATILTVDPTD